MQNINPEFWLFFSSQFCFYLAIFTFFSEFWVHISQFCCRHGIFVNLNSQFSQLQTSQFGLFFFELRLYISSGNSDFFLRILHLKLTILSLSKKKKSELWDKKSQLTWRKRSSIAYSGQASIRHHKRIIKLSTGGQIFRSVVDHWVLTSKWKMYLLFNCIILNKPIILNQNILTQFSSELSDFSLMMYTRLPQSFCPLKLRPFLTINYKLASRSASICRPAFPLMIIYFTSNLCLLISKL